MESNQKRERVPPNPETVAINNQLTECGSRKQLSRARTLFSEAQTNGLANDFTFGIMVNVCIRCGQLPEAEKVFAEMKKLKMRPGVVTYTTLLKGLCSEGRVADSLQLLTEMQQSKVRPNVRTFNTFLRGCQQSGAVEQAELIFRKLGTLITPDASSYEMYMALLCQGLRWQSALNLLERATFEQVPSPGVHLSVARAALFLGENDVAFKQLKAFDQLVKDVGTTAVEGKAPTPRKATTGGKQAWKGDDQERQRSAEVFNLHRIAEQKREAALIRKMLDKTREKRLDMLPFYPKLLLFSLDEDGENQTATTLLQALAKFGFEEYLHRLSERSKSGSAASSGSGAKDKESKEEAEGRQLAANTLSKFVDPFGRVRFMWLFTDEAGHASKLPVKMEIGSGTGDWVNAQAHHDKGKANWVSLEMRYDRVYHTFARMILHDVHNLCVMGGDATRVLPLHVAPKQLSALFINHPEPPQQINAQSFESEGAHLLSAPFFLEMHRVLAPQGTLTIVTDNLWYGRSLLRIVADLKLPSQDESGKDSGLAFKSVSLTNPKEEELQGFTLYRNPGPECGIAVASSSYFDRLWVQEKLTQRYFLYLTKVDPQDTTATTTTTTRKTASATTTAITSTESNANGTKKAGNNTVPSPVTSFTPNEKKEETITTATSKPKKAKKEKHPALQSPNTTSVQEEAAVQTKQTKDKKAPAQKQQKETTSTAVQQAQQPDTTAKTAATTIVAEVAAADKGCGKRAKRPKEQSFPSIVASKETTNEQQQPGEKEKKSKKKKRKLGTD